MSQFGTFLHWTFFLVIARVGCVHSTSDFIQRIPCRSDEIMVQQAGENSTYCTACPVCRRGRGPSIQCGSVLKLKKAERPRLKCRRCKKGTFSDSRSLQGCQPCAKCMPGERVIRNCTRWSNTICSLSCQEGYYLKATFPDSRSLQVCQPCAMCRGHRVIRNCTKWSNTICSSSCKEGFYFDQVIGFCLPCCRCCNDSKDVKIDECMTKGSHHHCSYESYCNHRSNRNLTAKYNQSLLASNQSINTSVLIHIKPKYTTNTTTTTRVLNSRNFIIVSAIILATLLVVTLFILIVRRRKRINKFKHCKRDNGIGEAITRSKKLGRCNDCIPLITSSKNNRFSHPYMSENDQSDDLNDFAKYDKFSALYIFNCLVYIRHDEDCMIDGDRNLVVEILDDDILNLRTIEPGYMFISPIFKFYSQGTEFEKPVEICLPHNALIDSGVKNWDVKVLCIDEREKHKSKWKEIESEVSIEWDNIKFYTKTLLTYAVVGKPITTAKKRMQFALFSMQKMISDRLEMTLYLLDESKPCLDRVIKENKNKGWEMLGCLYAVFIDFCNPVDIIINIEELVEPWSLVHLKDEVISSQLLRDSYFNIPSVHAVFRRSERRATTFSCHFRVAIGGSEIIIPAVTFVPEELMCVFVDVHNEDPSLSERQTLLSEVPYDIMYQMCRKLDIPARGRGQWRDVGRHFGVSEVELQSCCKEYASIDGSPSRALMEFIFSQRPKITVGEFIKFLDEYGRGDVVSVLSKVK